MAENRTEHARITASTMAIVRTNALLFINLQIILNGHCTTDHADEESDDQEHHQHGHRHNGQRYDVDKCHGVPAGKIRHNQRVDAAFKQEGDECTGDAQDKSFHHEGPSDKPVGGAHHLHNGNFLFPFHRGELDGVCHDKQGHGKQDDRQHNGDHADHVAQRNQALGNGLAGVDRGNARNVFQGHLGFGQQGDIVHIYGIPVPQNTGIHVIKQGVVIAAGKALHGVVLADKITGCDIGNGKDLGLERLGLFFGIGIVHKRENDVFILQRADDLVDVDGQQGKAAHDQQTGNDHTDRRKGHESVGKDTAKALLEVISNSVSFSPSYGSDVVIVRAHNRNIHLIHR